MKVSAIVVTYNRLNKLRNCLKHLLHQSYELNNIVIINNRSSDGTEQYLDNLNNDYIIIKNMNKNVGGAGGFSAGIRLAFERTNSDFFWLMDDDAVPTVNALKELVVSIKRLHGYFGFLCSNVRLCDNNYPCNLPSLHNGDWDIMLPGNLIKVENATFVSYLFSRSIVQRFGLPVRQMFIWGDDYEYSLRISKHIPCYFVANSIVMHDSPASESSILNMDPKRDIYLRYSLRNSLYAIRKHKNTKDFIIKLIRDIYIILKVPFVSKRTRVRKMIYMIYGLIQGIFFNPQIEFPKNVRNNRK